MFHFLLQNTKKNVSVFWAKCKKCFTLFDKMRKTIQFFWQYGKIVTFFSYKLWKLFLFFPIKCEKCFTFSTKSKKYSNFFGKMRKMFQFFRQNAKIVSFFFLQKWKLFHIFWQDAKSVSFFPTKSKKCFTFFDRLQKCPYPRLKTSPKSYSFEILENPYFFLECDLNIVNFF